MSTLTPDPTSSYLTLRALEAAGFPYEACIKAVGALFPDPTSEPDPEQAAPTIEPEHPFVAARRDGRVFLRRLSDDFEPLPAEED